MKITLALSGGGTRGYAHIGALRALEEAGLEIAGIAGCSAGGMIGGLYAAGYSAEQMTADIRELLSFRGIVRSLAPGRGVGLLRQYRLDHRFRRNLSRFIAPDLTFDALRVPFAVNAVCLTCQREQVLDSGNVTEAIRATVAVPGFFGSVEIEGCRYVDGGVLNNVPTNLARELAEGVVVAVDVGSGHLPMSARPLLSSAVPLQPMKDLLDTINLWTTRYTLQALEESPPDVLIRPILPTANPIADMRQVDQIIDAGYVAMHAALPEIYALGGAESLR